MSGAVFPNRAGLSPRQTAIGTKGKISRRDHGGGHDHTGLMECRHQWYSHRDINVSAIGKKDC